MLTALQPIGRTQRRIQRCRQGGSIPWRIKPNGSRSLLGNFAMPSGIACNDRQSGQQKVKNLVGDREIATPAIFHLPGKADVMFSNAREQFIIVDDGVHEYQFPPLLRHVAPQPGLEACGRRAAQVNLGTLVKVWQRREQILQAAAGPQSLREPMNGSRTRTSPIPSLAVNEGSIPPSERIIDYAGRSACMLTRKHKHTAPG